MDLISRQAAIDAADYTDYTGLAIEDVKKVTDEVVKELKKLPAVERKKGRWVKMKIGWKCSECTLCTNNKGTYEFNFCPNCGVEMEKKKMSRYVDLSNPKIFHNGRDKFGNGIYHIPPDLPTDDVVERKKATLLNANPYGECSNCGDLIDSREGFNYCPNCGAELE